MKNTHLLPIFCAAALLTSANATSIAISGDTTTSPTYNRVTESGTLSGFATAVPFSLYLVTVNNTGLYSFSVSSSTPTLLDTFISLNSPIFDSAAADTDFLIANDNTTDSNPAAGSSFSYNLSSGTNYYFSVTGLTNDDYGVFSGSVSGAGANTPTVTAVPEASTISMYALVLGGLALVIARKRRVA